MFFTYNNLSQIHSLKHFTYKGNPQKAPPKTFGNPKKVSLTNTNVYIVNVPSL